MMEKYCEEKLFTVIVCVWCYKTPVFSDL